MEDALDEWSTNSNDAIQISLVVPSEQGSKPIYSFRPRMSCAIFGEEENIAGYKDLKISIRYHACDMRPGLQITYSKKMKTIGDQGPTNLKEIFESYLPRSAFEKGSVFDAAIKDPSYSTWRPPGELWKTIQSGNQTYEVWRGNLADLAVQQMVKRIQILVSFFIEGGIPIELKEPDWSLQRWTIFFLYRKKNFESSMSSYIFMGYSTVYQYYFVSAAQGESGIAKTLDFKFPITPTPSSSLPCRSRISQFIILPPFQGAGNGSRFYNAIFDYYLKHSQTVEITVEDPNEAFDDLRDLNDLARLRMIPEFKKLTINTAFVPRKSDVIPGEIINRSILDNIRKDLKIAPRQFARVVEMQLLSLISPELRSDSIMKGNVPRSSANKHEYRLWKLLVKARLFLHNRDTLIQLDYPDRIEKLEQTLWNVEQDYERLLRAHETRSSPKLSDSNLSSLGEKGSNSDEPGESGEPAAKRVKHG
ncbi:Histone acetyltransferase type B catalytic subunit [Podosphaera aphanis]|nr:Histone acetyltransferase type B catalytic subunit [Podosphaera aphanis]